MFPIVLWLLMNMDQNKKIQVRRKNLLSSQYNIKMVWSKDDVSLLTYLVYTMLIIKLQDYEIVIYVLDMEMNIIWVCIVMLMILVYCAKRNVK